MDNKIICIVGPTGVGKTALSLALAQELQTEIINGDAFQVYQEMDILTAKPTAAEQSLVKHHLIDYLSITDGLDIARFKNEATAIINDLFKAGQVPIIVGGSGLYLKSLLYDYELNDLKARADEPQNSYADYSNEALYELLVSIDYEASLKLHPNNRKRVLRAIDIYESNGITKSAFIKQQRQQPVYDVLFIGLRMERDLLYRHLNARVDKMMNAGLLEEVTNLYHKYHTANFQALQAIGYKEFIPYFEEKISLDQALEEVKKNTRRYAKKQYTWFNNQMEVNWLYVDLNDFDKTIAQAMSLVRSFIDE